MLVPCPEGTARPAGATDTPRRDVAVVPWPSRADARTRARVAGTPCLLVVDPGIPAPTDCDLDEDWVDATTSAADVHARIDRLARRQGHTAALGPHVLALLSDIEVDVFAALDHRPGRITHRARLARVVGPDGSPDDGTLGAVLRRLSRHIRPAGLELLELGDGGVLLARHRVTR